MFRRHELRRLVRCGVEVLLVLAFVVAVLVLAEIVRAHLNY